MSFRRQRSIPLGGRYRQVSLYDICDVWYWWSCDWRTDFLACAVLVANVILLFSLSLSQLVSYIIMVITTISAISMSINIFFWTKGLGILKLVISGSAITHLPGTPLPLSPTRIYYSSVPDGATNCPCGVCCCGSNMCLQHIIPLFGNLD